MSRRLVKRAGRVVLVLVATVALGAAALAALGFLGRAHGVFDSLAHFRTHFAALAILAGLVALGLGAGAERLVGLAAAAVGVAAMVTVAPFVLPQATAPGTSADPGYALLQMNVLFFADIGPALQRIEETKADVVTLQEVRPDLLARLATLADYPHRIVCPAGPRARGEVILSRRPPLGDPVCPWRATIGTFDFDGTPLTVVSAHLQWPWPRDQAQDVRTAAPTLRALAGAVIVAGDFNAAPWSRAVRSYATLSGTTPVAGIGFTWPNGFGLPRALTRWVGLPLDNVLVSPQLRIVSAGTLAPTRSDHLPVLVRFTLEPRAQDPARPIAAAEVQS